MLVSWMFISFYITIYFFVKKFIFFNVYFSEYDIPMSLYVFLVEKVTINQVHTQLAGDRGFSKMRTAVYR